MKQYSRVKLLANKFESEGVNIGDIGYIIEVYDNETYEVEFSDSKTGFTIGQIVANLRDIELAE